MRIVLHIGPHKTGTTSIQKYLLERWGGERPSGKIWYPAPDVLGPGHATLAFRLLDHASADTLQARVEAAAAAQVNTLLLSAEDFSLLYDRPAALRILAVALSRFRTTLVTTQNSLVERFASAWAEYSKHRHVTSMEEEKERIFALPAYQADFVERFAEAIQPDEIAMVCSTPNDPPGQLIRNMLRACRLPKDDSKTDPPRENVRMGRIEAEVLRGLNRAVLAHAPDMGEAAYSRLVARLGQAMLTQTWRQDCPAVAIEAPPDIAAAAAERARRFRESLDALQGWPLRIFGDPEVLVGRKGASDLAAAG